MEGKVYGYARVSSKDQNLDRQLDALAEFGVEGDMVFADKASGKDFDRPEYKRLVAGLAEGDVVVVKSIDRLGRNYDEILEEWRSITKERKSAIVVLDMPLLDTREKPGGLTSVFIADLVLQLLSYVAQVESESIKQRQGLWGGGLPRCPRSGSPCSRGSALRCAACASGRRPIWRRRLCAGAYGGVRRSWLLPRHCGAFLSQREG